LKTNKPILLQIGARGQGATRPWNQPLH